MSQPKAQLLDPQGNISLPGITATGVITATSYVGSGANLTGIESWNQQDTWLYS